MTIRASRRHHLRLAFSAEPDGAASGLWSPDRAARARRIGDLAGAIAIEAGWGVLRCERLMEAAACHDEGIGAVGAPAAEPGVLSAAEFAEVRARPLLSARALEPFLGIEQLGWVLHHHERWDGLGYPDGLVGEEIPEGARILALADAWDAMTSWRPYRPARDFAAAIAECWRCAGRQFDPEIVRALTRVRPAPSAQLSEAR